MSEPFSIDASAVGRKADDYANLSRLIPREIKKRLGWIAEELERQTKRFIGEGLFRKPTGTLMRKINAGVYSDDTIIMHGGTKYTLIQDIGGTVPRHFIAPVHAKALSWTGAGGVRLFSKGHFVGPSTIKPKHFTRAGWERTKPYAVKTLTEVRDMIAKGRE